MTQVNVGTWSWDSDTNMLADSATGKSGPMPDVTKFSAIYGGFSYWNSQAATRTAGDTVKRRYAEANNLKLADVPKSFSPKDEPDYADALADARAKLFDKMLAGYEVGAREGSADPYEDKYDALARQWFQGFAESAPAEIGGPWYVNPGRTNRVAKDEDPYLYTKHGSTFGEALAMFKVSQKPAAQFALTDQKTGQPWPFKLHKGETVVQALDRETRAQLAASAKGGKTVATKAEAAAFESL